MNDFFPLDTIIKRMEEINKQLEIIKNEMSRTADEVLKTPFSPKLVRLKEYGDILKQKTDALNAESKYFVRLISNI